MQGLIKNLKRLLYVGIALAMVAAAATIHFARPSLPNRSVPPITDAKVWGYQLQRARADHIPAEIDVLVIDSARSTNPRQTLSPDEVARFQTRSLGGRRLVLAYLSVGEAENYRYYWWPYWSTRAPSWLAKENQNWKGNFQVRYWEPGWRNIIMNPRPTILDYVMERAVDWHKPYLDRIIEAGFDGVYLDRIDAFMEWKTARPSAEMDMASLVIELATYAKQRRPGFLIVTQNGEELLRHSDIRRVVDAAAKEDLWFGIDGAEIANSQRDVSRTLLYLNRMRADGKPVFVVEYLDDPSKREATRKQAADRGLILTFAPRPLDKPPEVITPLPPSPSQAPAQGPAPAPAAASRSNEPAPAKPKD